MRHLTVGLLINPLAGTGGPLALKGSDQLALSDFFSPVNSTFPSDNNFNLHALKRTTDFCNALGECVTAITWRAPQGIMGGNVLQSLGIEFQPTETQIAAIPSVADTQALVAEYCACNVDLIIFAGGDGTAAAIAEVIAAVNPHQLVLGIPAGVKIQSGVFAINPTAAGQLLAALVRGDLLNTEIAQVRDLDELALQQGQVKSRYMGTLRVPFDGHFVQSVKQGGLVAEELVISDIAAYLQELVPIEATVVFGPGKTMADIQTALALPYTLLGFDVFKGSSTLALDADGQQLSALLTNANNVWVFLTVIGGQGHIIGRGNQQLSAALLKVLGRNAIYPIATKEKLASVTRGKLLMDSGDAGLDRQWQGLIPVICGYREHVLCDLLSIPEQAVGG